MMQLIKGEYISSDQPFPNHSLTILDEHESPHAFLVSNNLDKMDEEFVRELRLLIRKCVADMTIAQMNEKELHDALLHMFAQINRVKNDRILDIVYSSSGDSHHHPQQQSQKQHPAHLHHQQQHRFCYPDNNWTKIQSLKRFGEELFFILFKDSKIVLADGGNFAAFAYNSQTRTVDKLIGTNCQNKPLTKDSIQLEDLKVITQSNVTNLTSFHIYVTSRDINLFLEKSCLNEKNTCDFFAEMFSQQQDARSRHQSGGDFDEATLNEIAKSTLSHIHSAKETSDNQGHLFIFKLIDAKRQKQHQQNQIARENHLMRNIDSDFQQITAKVVEIQRLSDLANKFQELAENPDEFVSSAKNAVKTRNRSNDCPFGERRKSENIGRPPSSTQTAPFNGRKYTKSKTINEDLAFSFDPPGEIDDEDRPSDLLGLTIIANFSDDDEK